MPYQSSGGRRNSVQLGVGPGTQPGAAPSPLPQRALDGIPGCVAWLALLVSLALAVVAPYSILVLASLLGIYSALRFLFAGIANFMGLRYKSAHGGRPTGTSAGSNRADRIRWHSTKCTIWSSFPTTRRPPPPCARHLKTSPAILKPDNG